MFMSFITVNRGFTLIELMVVMAIVGILATIGVPAMRDTIERNAVSGHVNTFMASLRFARSEAIKSGVPVVMCRSTNPESGAPTCATGSGTNGWASGWIVFVNRDLDSSSDFNSASGDALLRAQGELVNSGGIVKTSGAAVNKFIFRPTGLMSAGASSFTFNSISLTSNQQKLVCISMQGRARVLADSFAACSSTDS
jgi:type IV fimbrial biogenesis protein FimT